MKERLTKLNVILSILLLFIPLILILVEGNIRESISDYAYSPFNYIFTSLLTVAGVMFIFNGTAYNKKWYNIVLGVSLIGVSVTPHLDYTIFHYLFASIFFMGSVAVMIIFSSRSQRRFKLFTGLFIVVTMLLHFKYNLYSLLYAEWIAILPICIHYIGEELGKID